MARGHRMKGRSGAWLRFALPYNRRRRDGRVAEGARLESVYTGNRIVGSNPTLSAITLVCIGLRAVVLRLYGFEVWFALWRTVGSRSINPQK